MAKFENIENIGKLISGGAVGELTRKVSVAEKNASDILKKLNDLQSAIRQRKLEEEQSALKVSEEETAVQPSVEVAETAVEPKAEEVQPAQEPVKETAPEPDKPTVKTEKKIEKPAEKTPPKRILPESTARRIASYQNGGSVQDSPKKPVRSENKTFINRDSRPPRNNGGAPSYPPRGNGQGGQRNPNAGGKYVAPAPLPQLPAKGKNFGPDKKKQPYEKTYIEKDKRTMSKRALVKQQGATVEDFDENKSGYRKLRVKKDKQKATPTIKSNTQS